jgi:YD repeat-containing protein
MPAYSSDGLQLLGSQDSTGWREVLTLTTALARVTTLLYDVMGRETGTIDAPGGRATMTWDTSGLETSSSNELGTSTATTFDSRGLVQQVLVSGTGVSATTLDSYDSAGRPIGERSTLGT